MEKTIKLDRLKEAIEVKIEEVKDGLTARETKKFTDLIESTSFIYDIVRNCADIIVDLCSELEAAGNELKQDFKQPNYAPPEPDTYYDDISVLGKLFEHVGSDYSASELKNKIMECMMIELNERYAPFNDSTNGTTHIDDLLN